MTPFKVLYPSFNLELPVMVRALPLYKESGLEQSGTGHDIDAGGRES